MFVNKDNSVIVFSPRGGLCDERVYGGNHAVTFLC